MRTKIQAEFSSRRQKVQKFLHIEKAEDALPDADDEDDDDSDYDDDEDDGDYDDDEVMMYNCT